MIAPSVNVSSRQFCRYYESWYMAPARTQKLPVLLLQKCMEPSRLSIANLITASLQIFATVKFVTNPL